MARLIKAIKSFDDLGNELGLKIFYRVGTDERTLFLSVAETEGKSTTQIKQLAQQKADQDTGLPGPTNERDDIIPNPVKETRQWLKNHPVILNTFEKSPQEIFDAVGSMTNAQRTEALAHALILLRVLVLERIAE